MNASTTIDDLYQVPDHAKAKIVHGEVLTVTPTGFLPGLLAARFTSVCATMNGR